MVIIYRVGVITGVKEAKVLEYDLPVALPDQVLIKNKICLICTTDYQQWMGLRPHQPIPMAFGHESAGIVEATGCNVFHVKEGDLVACNGYRPCMVCESCKSGKNSSYCQNSPIKDFKRDAYGLYGLYACGEYQIVEAKHVYKLKPGAAIDTAAFCEPVSTVIHGINRIRVKPGERVLVIGAGTMGLINAEVARFFGADVIISELSDKKLEMAAAMGFNKLIDVRTDDINVRVSEFTNGHPVDAIIIAVGVTAAYKQAFDAAQMGCRLLIFAGGYPPPSWDTDPNRVHYQMTEIIGTYGCSPADFQYAADLLGEKKINLDKLIEGRYPLDDVQKAFEMASSGDAYRYAVML